MLPLLLMLADAPALRCGPLAGARPLVARRSIRWLVAGEAHGTNEYPRALADLVCAAVAAHRPVVVALEYRQLNQVAIDAYLASDGGAEAQAALLAAPLWDRKWADGKNSRAMFDLMEWLRVQHRRGSVSRVVAFDVDRADGGGGERDRVMAEHLRAIDPGRRGIVIVLTGGAHAIKRIVDKEVTPYPPAASLLPPEQTVSLRLQGNGGQNWVCREDGCGIHDAQTQGGPIRQLDLKPVPGGNFDGVLDLGVPITPSAPVKDR